jgi:hypothetical protein
VDYSGIRVGPQTLADGVPQASARGSKEGALITANLAGYYEEAVARGQMFSLTLNAITTTINAGNIVAAAAAAATQFALFNPVGSGKNLVLIEFGLGYISGTAPAGPVFHGYIANIPTSAAAGTILSNLLGGGASSVAKPNASAAGVTLTSGLAPVTHKVANFANTATAAAAAFPVGAVEQIDGKLVVPPGVGWLPLFSGAGTTALIGLSVTWREVAI